MKIFSTHSIAAFLLISATSSFCMDDQRILAPLATGAGIFDISPTKELFYPLLFQADIPERNALRKTCKSLRKFLSFLEPSAFILDKNFYAHQKDIDSIFYTAIFERNCRVVEAMENNHEPQKVYEIKARFYQFGPPHVAYVSGYEYMCNKFPLGSHSVFSSIPTPLVMACVGRNSQRIDSALNDKKFYTDTLPKILTAFRKEDSGCLYKKNHSGKSLALYIVIANEDITNLMLLLGHLEMQDQIKKCGHKLLQFSIYLKKKKSTQVLIESKCCDFNEKMVDVIADIRSWARHTNKKYSTLFDVLFRHDKFLRGIVDKNDLAVEEEEEKEDKNQIYENSIWLAKIETLLSDAGAILTVYEQKTDLLAITEFIRKMYPQ